MSRNKPASTAMVKVENIDFSHQDIFSVVDSFYRQVAQDQLLKEPFKSVQDWPEHIERLTHFWWIRFGGQPYMFSQYNPILKHFYAGFNRKLLEHWLKLFQKVLDEKLTQQQANLWKEISAVMGQGLNARNEMLKKQHQQQEKNQ